MMKAIETTGKIDDQGRLFLAQPLALASHSHVRIIVLVPEETDIDPDDDPPNLSLKDFGKASMRQLPDKPSPCLNCGTESMATDPQPIQIESDAKKFYVYTC